MAVKKFHSNKEKPGWKYDERKKQFWSWGFDIRTENGRRKRESGFGSKQLAENAVARIRISEKEGKYHLTQKRFSARRRRLPPSARANRKPERKGPRDDRSAKMDGDDSARFEVKRAGVLAHQALH